MTAKRITDTNVVMATFCLIDNLLKRGRYLFPWWVLLPMHNKLYDILIRLFSGSINVTDYQISKKFKIYLPLDAMFTF